jgi:hypothetical protein
MKVEIKKLTDEVLRQTHPITGRVAGWFFRCEEQSNNVWHAEGTDAWGRKVSATDDDYGRALDNCFKAAEQINEQLSAKRA